ncbi:hypothetical protein DXT76_20595, partial [Halobacillus trueperi]
MTRNHFPETLLVFSIEVDNMKFSAVVIPSVKAWFRALYACYCVGVEDPHLGMYRGSFLTYIERGGWEAARLPWEKEIGE